MFYYCISLGLNSACNDYFSYSFIIENLYALGVKKETNFQDLREICLISSCCFQVSTTLIFGLLINRDLVIESLILLNMVFMILSGSTCIWQQHVRKNFLYRSNDVLRLIILTDCS